MLLYWDHLILHDHVKGFGHKVNALYTLHRTYIQSMPLFTPSSLPSSHKRGASTAHATKNQRVDTCCCLGKSAPMARVQGVCVRSLQKSLDFYHMCTTVVFFPLIAWATCYWWFTHAGLGSKHLGFMLFSLSTTTLKQSAPLHTQCIDHSGQICFDKQPDRNSSEWL